MSLQVLLEEANPYQTQVAQVESDGRTVYLYLSPVDDLPGQTRAIWIQNLESAPASTDRAAMQSGQAPLRKQSACRHPEGSTLYKNEELDLVWFPEGSGVSLYRNGEVEAILPPWSGRDGMMGYAREALELDIGTLPLPEKDSGLYTRLKENLEFWNLRAKPEFWPAFRDSLLAQYEKVYGKHIQYYALSDRKYPPIGIVEFKHPSSDDDTARIFATLGMSYQPMPGVEGFSKEPIEDFRAEIITTGSSDQHFLPGLLGRLSVYPWLSGTFLTDGHRYESGMEYEKSDFIFTKDFKSFGLPELAVMKLEDLYPINWLYAVPVDQESLLVARVKGADFALKKLQ